MSDTERVSRLGLNILEQSVLEAGHIFREQPTSDYGIDAHIEIKDGAAATGRLIAAQVKAGPSSFSNEVETGFWYYIEDRHKKLWINHSLPVILVLCDVDNRFCYYEIISEESCIPAGSRWKLLVKKNNLINSSASEDLICIASPLAAASDYTICAESDQSYGNVRRISLDIVVHPGSKPANKPLLGAIVRAALKCGQSSQYYRDAISRKALSGRPIDVVWGFVYLRDVDRKSASWTCRFQWVSENLEADWKPCAFDGEQDGSGLVIDWNANEKLPKFLDERRSSKGVYLENVDDLISGLPSIREMLASLIELGEASQHSAVFADLSEQFESKWGGNIIAPAECQRLDQAIHDLLATVGNAGLIWGQRNLRGEAQVRLLMRGYHDDLDRLNRDISFLRADVR